jgi:hypothetical protein
VWIDVYTTGVTTDYTTLPPHATVGEAVAPISPINWYVREGSRSLS